MSNLVLNQEEIESISRFLQSVSLNSRHFSLTTEYCYYYHDQYTQLLQYSLSLPCTTLLPIRTTANIYYCVLLLLLLYTAINMYIYCVLLLCSTTVHYDGVLLTTAYCLLLLLCTTTVYYNYLLQFTIIIKY